MLLSIFIAWTEEETEERIINVWGYVVTEVTLIEMGILCDPLQGNTAV